MTEKEDNLIVCFHCLRAIESKEGKQPVREVTFDEEEGKKCDWCGDELEEGYEILPD